MYCRILIINLFSSRLLIVTIAELHASRRNKHSFQLLRLDDNVYDVLLNPCKASKGGEDIIWYDGFIS